MIWNILCNLHGVSTISTGELGHLAVECGEEGVGMRFVVGLRREFLARPRRFVSVITFFNHSINSASQTSWLNIHPLRLLAYVSLRELLALMSR
jgi:hypothetical protein